MVRAVRERRRNIGVLRALGFQAGTVQRAFLTESSFVALEGILVGAVLGVVTTYLLFQNDPSFDNASTGFPRPLGEHRGADGRHGTGLARRDRLAGP
jgi:putative ABC transport system permease protein